MAKKDNDEEITGCLLTEILFENASCMTYRLYEIDDPENKEILSCIGTFSLSYKKGMNREQKKELLNKKIEENMIFRHKFQDTINKNFEEIMKKL